MKKKVTKKTTKAKKVTKTTKAKPAAKKTSKVIKKKESASSPTDGIKIADLAKDLKLTPKGLISKLSELGIGISSDASSLDQATIKKINRALSKKVPTPAISSEKKLAPRSYGQKYPRPKAQGPRHKPPALRADRPGGAQAQSKQAPMQAGTEAVPQEKTPEKEVEKKPLKLDFPISVKDFSFKMSISPGLLIKELMGMEVMVTINQFLDQETAKKVGDHLGFNVEALPTVEEQTLAVHEKEDESKLVSRAPIITFMGHVDHGKTSLLDYIRKSKIANLEKGGITQHIGAYRVSLDKGDITFLDTPGHEAFTAMRARGAIATDIVILVVAADDGIKPQTIEAIDHAKAAGVPIVVAINKIDKEHIDIDRVKKQLAEHELNTEDWGGKTIAVGVSALTGEGVDKLLEMILLESEMLELKADPTKAAKGIVIEGKLSKGGGPIATILVQSGTLRPTDLIVCGRHYGRIKALINDRIHKVKEASPSMPVEILGLNGVPEAGDAFFVVDSEKKAKEIVQSRVQKAKDQSNVTLAKKISLEDLYSQIQKGNIKELKIILRLLKNSLSKMLLFICILKTVGNLIFQNQKTNCLEK